MAINLDKKCSVYRDALDNYGRFVDQETGEIIQQISIRDFCLSERWRPAVERLRSLIAEFGPAAKKSEEYILTKQRLPAATLSGLFEIREEYNAKRNRMERKSRVASHLAQHTGFLCIDIDNQDNLALGSMNIVLRTLRQRPEVALLMRSCSGTGYFALIPLAFPDRHREHFASLMREYASLGISVDRQCGDVTRVRFASYDSCPYVNPAATPYTGLHAAANEIICRRSRCVISRNIPSVESSVQRVEILVKKLEEYGIDITNSYGDWIRVGLSLANLPEPYGRHFFHRVSALCSKYNSELCDRKFDKLMQPDRIGLGTFFSICRDYGVTLRN